MALPTSGALSASMINVELTRASTATFSMNGADERTLAGRPTANSTISFNDFYGKSFSTDGGYYPSSSSNNVYYFMDFASETLSSISITGSFMNGANFGAPSKSAGYVLSVSLSPIRFSKIAFNTNTSSQITTVFIDAGFHAGVYADSSKGYFSRGSTNPNTGGNTNRDAYRVNLSNETLTFLGNLFPSNFFGSGSLSHLGVSGYFIRGTLNSGSRTDLFFKLTYANETTSTVTIISSATAAGAGWSNSPTAGYFHTRSSGTRTYRKFTYSNDTATSLTAPSNAPGLTPTSFSNVGVSGYLSASGTNSSNKLAYSNDTWSTTTPMTNPGTQGFSTFL